MMTKFCPSHLQNEINGLFCNDDNRKRIALEPIRLLALLSLF